MLQLGILELDGGDVEGVEEDDDTDAVLSMDSVGELLRYISPFFSIVSMRRGREGMGPTRS